MNIYGIIILSTILVSYVFDLVADLLNLSALQRRLTLDFCDIFKKGFSFDSIEGDFLLDSGDAYTNNFVMKGPSAIIEIYGRIGIYDESFDQLVIVTPKIASTLPLAGILAGGPAVGAALFLAEKLVGKQFDRITQVEYLVTGSWSDPTFTTKPRGKPAEPNNPFDMERLGKTEEKWQLPSPLGQQHYSLTQEQQSDWEEAMTPNITS